MTSVNRTRLPEIPEPQSQHFQESVKELLELLLGRRRNADTAVRLITAGDLEDAGIVRIKDGRRRVIDPALGVGEAVEPTGEGVGVWGLPEKPQDVQVTTTRLNIILEWSKPKYAGHWRTEIWRAEANDIGQAVLIGTTRALIYGDLIGLTDATRYYWLRHVNMAGQPGPYHAGPTDGASGTTGKITSSDIETVAADKVVALALSAISANLGDVVAGNLQSPDGTFEIDLDNGSLVIAGPGGRLLDNYVIMTRGRLEYFRWTGAGHVLYKSLKHRESGVCSSGDLVTIPGFFEAEPEIILTPRRIRTYDRRFPDQNQVLELLPTAVTEFLDGRWRFNATARLLLSGSAGGESVNDSSGVQSGNTHTSDLQTTPANTTEFTVHVRVSSVRGTGTAPNYRKRRVRWRIKYRRVGTSTFSFTSYTTVNIGASFSPKSSSRTISGLTAGDYQFAVEFVAEDDSGTFTSGSPSYEFSEETLQAAGPTTVTSSARFGEDSVPKSVSGGITLPESAVNTTWEIYQLQYSWEHDFAHSAQFRGPNRRYYGSSQASEVNGNHSYTYEHLGSQPESVTGVADAKSLSGSNLTYNRNYVRGTVTVTSFHPSSSVGTTITASLTFRNAKVVIKRRKAAANTTTPQNEFVVTSYDYVLSSAQVLASGTLNWVALGE